MNADPATRLIFTTRESLPAPFDDPQAMLTLGRLSKRDAVRLVEQVMAQHNWTPPAADDGRTPEEVEALVEAVHGHARALVLLAPEVARRGVRAATADLHTLMAALDNKFPDQREKSLFASVELSLQRLPTEVRQVIGVLGVFHGGVTIGNLAMMLTEQIESEEQAQQAGAAATAIAQMLVEVGLGEMMDYGYLRLDPALPPYLATALTPAASEALRARWAAAMMQLVDFLYQQRSKDAQLQSQLTLLELPNLLALLDWLPGHAGPVQTVSTAGSIEQLLANLGRPAALARTVAVREAAAKEIGGWSHAQSEHERLGIERLLAAGDLNRAYRAAIALQQRALAAGETAYPGADYDIGVAQLLLGRVLKNGGQAGAALQPLAVAQRRFQALADVGNASAARMASVAITEQADCLLGLGRLEDAANAYQQAFELDEKRGDKRDIAVGRIQLGTVRMLQERNDDALAAYEDALAIFEGLGEPGMLATAWHQIGMVHRRAHQFEAAERAYRQALSLYVSQHDRTKEAGSLTELGNLYNVWGRPEEAVTFYRQAADMYTALGDRRMEGFARSNTADTLIKLTRYDEARPELSRGIECITSFGHSGEPWKAWSILYDLEQAAGNGAAATAAWRQARDAYLAYRRDGGYAQTNHDQVCDQILAAIQNGDLSAGRKLIDELRKSSWPPAFIAALESTIDGERARQLGDDSQLSYSQSAELLLLLERLGG